MDFNTFIKGQIARYSNNFLLHIKTQGFRGTNRIGAQIQKGRPV